MMFNTDLHIHSKYSRATAKNLDFENLYMAAQIKGITVVGTGDFTFPAWVDEMAEKLEPAEPGLFALKKEIATELDKEVPPACRNRVRFMLQSEISNIYKKDGRVRKNHNVIYFPDLGSVKRFNARLDAIGNIKSDGRPILGLDARDLLEIMLEIDDRGFFMPAHIWTPWFSLFGSKSGFDAMADCFGDLTGHIFACETGLSSDPPMNWRVADLDHVRLMSNSDAHSPGYLGRNASRFDTDLDYFAMRRALETNDCSAYLGTLDMHPDHGKYHYDGHRKCGVRLNPDESAALDNICPECGKPLTLGVLHRVRELADRPEGFAPEGRAGYTRIVPLADILSEIFGVGPKTKKVTGYYNRAVEALGPELSILTERTVEEIESAGVPLLGEAVRRMRSGDIRVEPGFDGEFGKVRIFSPEERLKGTGQKQLFKMGPEKKRQAKPDREKRPKTVLRKRKRPREAEPLNDRPADPGLLEGLNPEQRRAVESDARAVLITAGPGTGKTRTLTARIAYLVGEKQVPPQHILALTFTNKAAREMEQRLTRALGGQAGNPGIDPGTGPGAGQDTDPGAGVTAATFHAFCLDMLKTHAGFDAGLLGDETRKELIETVVAKVRDRATGNKGPAKRLDRLISLCKQQFLGPEDDLSAIGAEEPLLGPVYTAFDLLLRELNLVDFEDLIFRFYTALTESPQLLSDIRSRFRYIFIDEYQDLNLGQYELVKHLARESHILVIGDPDQSIYGFRGSDNAYFNRFTADYPGCKEIVLTQNYRSTQTILDASFQMISKRDEKSGSQKIYSNLDTAQKLIIKEAATARAEAVAVGKMIEAGIGGLSFYSMDARTDEGLGDKSYSFGDFAVLYRTRKQMEIFAEVFHKEGIPFQTADKQDGFDLDGIRELLACFRLITGRSGPKDLQLLSDHFSARGAEGVSDAWLEKALAPVRQRIMGLETREALGLFEEFLGLEENPDAAIISARERLIGLAGALPSPTEFMDRLALDQDPDLLADSVEKVSLMTMHAAKGLEFPVVFVTGCEQGLVPFARDGKTVENEEEERRLFYVAMTRAMDILCLTYAQKRPIFGLNQNRRRSFFIDDIEKRLARYEKRQPLKKAETPRETQMELF